MRAGRRHRLVMPPVPSSRHRAARRRCSCCSRSCRGCGSAAADELPPAAEPASSPPATAAPDGRLVPVGFKPEGVVADPRTGLVAVGLRGPDELALVDGATGDVERRVALPAAPRHLALDGDSVLVPAEDADAARPRRAPGGRGDGGAPPAASRTTPPPRAGACSSPTSSRTRSRCSRATARSRASATALQPGGVTPLDRGRKVAVVSVRERVVEVFDAATGERTGPRARRRRADARRLGRRRLPVRHRHGRRRAARLPPAPDARADPALPAARLAVRHRDRQPPPPHVRHPDRAQPAHRADRRRPAEPGPAATRRRASRTRSRSTRRPGACSSTGKVDGVLQLLDPVRERTR